MGGLDMYDFGARHYTPALPRWLTMDPFAEKYVSFTPYSYCYGNPIRYVDPDGSDGWDTTWGYVIGGITNVVPGSGKLRDLYRPHDSGDYNRALEKCDKAAMGVGEAIVGGGKELMRAGEIGIATGLGAMGVGATLVVSVAGSPEGGALFVGGTEIAVAGAQVGTVGVAATMAGANLMMNAASNSSEGYDRGGTRADDAHFNGKNEKHGDGGRGFSKTEKQRSELLERIKNASSKKERRDLENKLKHINRDAQKKSKGEEHSRSRKR